MHTPLVDQETFDLAQKVLDTHPSRPGPKNAVTKNPLAGLVFCGNCGRAMVRRPFQSGREEVLLCPYTSCHMKASDLQLVESILLSLIADMFEGLESPQRKEDNGNESEREALRRALVFAEKEMASLCFQEKRAFELVEQNVYSVSQFTMRTKELSERKQALAEKINTIQKEKHRLEVGTQMQSKMTPKLHHVLDSYHETNDVSEKNAILKSVLSKVMYTKTTGGRYQASNLKLIVFPRVDFSDLDL